MKLALTTCGTSLFEHLAPYDRIFVTGPHRAGTTITTEMIANDLGLRCFREEVVGFNNEQAFRLLINDRSQRGYVLQCPALFHLIREVEDPRTAVVFMKRKTQDVARSQSNQTYPGGRPLPFDSERKAQQRVLGIGDEDPNEAKWRLWKEWAVLNGFVQNYEQLKDHPMWVDKKGRKGWHHRQTSKA